MSDQMIFKRYELKYLITKQQYTLIKEAFAEHMCADIHGKNTICSLYYDTPDFRLIRRSLEKPIYKEKLRLRSYGVAGNDTLVFVELKKKYKSVVYKRRVGLSEKEATEYLKTQKTSHENQITKEINYTMNFYKELAPAMLLTYEREAFYEKDNHEFRITFDQNILWRNYDLELTKGIYGTPILNEDQILMEIKTADAIPLWMVDILTANHIYKTSFSKYGIAYQTVCQKKKINYLQEGN